MCTKRAVISRHSPVLVSSCVVNRLEPYGHPVQAVEDGFVGQMQGQHYRLQALEGVRMHKHLSSCRHDVAVRAGFVGVEVRLAVLSHVVPRATDGVLHMHIPAAFVQDRACTGGNEDVGASEMRSGEALLSPARQRAAPACPCS